MTRGTGSEEPPVLQIGDPRLREVAREVEDPARDVEGARRLQGVLERFRVEHGFGRAIAAPQIGMGRRFVALHLGDRRFVAFNPEIVWRSGDTFTLWDDCMSFPWLMVRVRRHQSVKVRYIDEGGREQIWGPLDRAESELLQHEIDHLDGVLAVDLALDRESLVSRAVWERDRDRFLAMVDHGGDG